MGMEMEMGMEMGMEMEMGTIQGVLDRPASPEAPVSRPDLGVVGLWLGYRPARRIM